MSDANTEIAEAPRTSKMSKGTRQTSAGLLLLVLLVWAANFIFVGNPVRSALATDPRNKRYKLVAHYHYYVDPTTLVLDVRSVDDAAPIDLFRGFFQSAQAMHEAGRSFSKIIVSRSRSAVFYMDGADFEQIGAGYGGGENIVYLIRTLPEKLHDPDGTPAYGTWTGGIIGVSLRQMQDVTDAGRRWAQGR